MAKSKPIEVKKTFLEWLQYIKKCNSWGGNNKFPQSVKEYFNKVYFN